MRDRQRYTDRCIDINIWMDGYEYTVRQIHMGGQMDRYIQEELDIYTHGGIDGQIYRVTSQIHQDVIELDRYMTITQLQRYIEVQIYVENIEIHRDTWIQSDTKRDTKMLKDTQKRQRMDG